MLEQIQHTLRWLVISTIVLFLLVAGISIYSLIINSHVHSALCTFRSDLQTRVNSTTHYLETHPGATPIPGVSRATLQQGRDNQQRTVDSLGSLGC